MLKRKRSKTKFFVVLGIILAILCSVVVGGYFAVDKFLVPTYFGKYGINDLHDLSNLVETIYVIPNEDTFITNPYTKNDANSITSKLALAGFPMTPSGAIDYEAIAKKNYTRNPSPDFVGPNLQITDKEVASILDEILDSGILITNVPDLSYFDTLQMDIKQVCITPYELLSTNSSIAKKNLIDYSSSCAKLSLTVKIATSSVRSQISHNLDTPQFLIDWIIPEELYISASMIVKTNELGEHTFSDASLSINSKTEKQSEILISLLLSFIYPEDEEMTPEKVASQIGEMAIKGIELIGDFKYVQIDTLSASSFGIDLVLSNIENQ